MDKVSSPSKANIYLFGMVVLSTIHRLDGKFPKLDTYGEINESFQLPGGEAGNSATVLRKLGYNVRIDGPFLGTRTKDRVLEFYRGIGVDCSGMEFAPLFGGVEDLVIVAEGSRTVFGRFARYFSMGRQWSLPDEKAIAAADIVGLDPFFFDESLMVSRLCVKHGVPYVTIDCAPDSEMCINAAAVVVSHEHLENAFPGRDPEEVMALYTEKAKGLVVFTFGGHDIQYGRRDGYIHHMQPCKVTVKSTLGAGDTFRAGIMHGIVNGMDDESTVRFGAALSASVCTRFPMALEPPSLEEINRLIAEQTPQAVG